MNDEEFVRSRIEEVHDNGVCLWVSLDQIYNFAPSAGKRIDDAWKRLRAFVEDRERQIAEVEEEIEVEQGCIESCETLSEIPEAKRHLAAHKRILLVEQERLKALKVGFKV
jgi:hypothetical protein